MPDEHFMTLLEAATYLRISPTTLYGWVHQRRIPYRKHGSRTVFYEEDLLMWSNANKIDSGDGRQLANYSGSDKLSSLPNLGKGSLTTEHDRARKPSP